MKFVSLVETWKIKVLYLVAIFVIKWNQPKFKFRVEIAKAVSNVVKQLLGLDGVDLA